MPTIEVAQPQAQFTPGAECALVQFQWRVAVPEGETPNDWNKKNYSPTQAALSARAPADVLALSPGYWGDAEVRADVTARIASEYGYTEITFLD